MRRPIATTLLTMALVLSAVGAAQADDEARLREGCSWLERAIAREPGRDDAFMMFMRGMRPKCGALLEGLARKDGSVTPKTITSILKELQDLRDVVDAEWKSTHPNEPDPASGPSPEERAAAEKAAVDKAEAERAAAEKAAADKAAADKAAADKAAADKAAADKAAADKAAAERAKLSEKERIAAEKAAAEEAKRLEKERIAAEKAAAEEAKRLEKERFAADKRAAEQADKERLAAEKAEKERLAADKRAAEQAEKERLATERAEREQLERDLAEAERIRREAARDAGPQEVAKAPTGGLKLDGTWEQPPTKILDRNVKRTLNLITKGKSIEGELYEEVWFPAPVAWIDRSCGGNTTFRMVTTARVTGEIEGRELDLRRDVPRVLACTCSQRCTVEERRRGMSFEISASGQQLTDDAGVFSRPGAAATVAGPSGGPSGTATGPVDIAGTWETSPFSAQDRKVVWRIEVAERDGRLVGTLTERSNQALPLQSWSDRFCDGADRWEWVTQWQADAKVPKGRKVTFSAKEGVHILCTCPSKCKDPDKKRVLELEIGPDGRTLSDGPRVFERR